MTATLYTKKGRRYAVWGNAESFDADRMQAGQWRMTYCPANGERRYSYDVKPEIASFVAACELALKAMESAIEKSAAATPSRPHLPYTKTQRAMVDKFRSDMAATGAFAPAFWTGTSARDIAQAGIDAVRQFTGGGPA